MARVVVVGAGAAGLACAYALARDGHPVTIVDPDLDLAALPVSANGAWFDWERPGIPHLRQAHGFVARFRAVLAEHAPELLADLVAAGAAELPATPALPPDTEADPADSELTCLGARRPLLDLVLARAVRACAEVRVVRERVSGLRAGPGSPPRVTGVVTPSGSVDADLVVDASGRGSRIAAWLTAIGAGSCSESAEPAAVAYYGRYFRLPAGSEPPHGAGIFGPRVDLGFASLALHRSDDRTFAITFATPPKDAELKVLRHEPVYNAAVASIAAVAPWLEGSEPIGPPRAFGGIWNRRRDFMPGGAMLARRLALAGDSRVHTDPADGLGATVALLHAFELAGALATERDIDGAIAAYHEATEGIDERVHTRVCEVDRIRNLGFEGRQGQPDDIAWIVNRVVPVAGRRDASVMRRFLRRAYLLDDSTALEEDLALHDHARRLAAETMASMAVPTPVADRRAAFLETLTAAAPLS